MKTVIIFACAFILGGSAMYFAPKMKVGYGNAKVKSIEEIIVSLK